MIQDQSVCFIVADALAGWLAGGTPDPGEKRNGNIENELIFKEWFSIYSPVLYHSVSCVCVCGGLLGILRACSTWNPLVLSLSATPVLTTQRNQHTDSKTRELRTHREGEYAESRSAGK